MSTLSILPREIIALITSYLIDPIDVNSLRLTGKIGVRYTQIGVTHLCPPRTWDGPNFIESSYALLFPHLENATVPTVSSHGWKYTVSIHVASVNDFINMASLRFLRNAEFRVNDHMTRDEECNRLYEMLEDAVPKDGRYYRIYKYVYNPSPDHDLHQYLGRFAKEITRINEIHDKIREQMKTTFRDGVIAFLSLMPADKRYSTYNFLFEHDSDIHIRVSEKKIVCCLQTFEMSLPLRQRFPDHWMVLDLRMSQWFQSTSDPTFSIYDKLVLNPYDLKTYTEETQKSLDEFLSVSGRQKLVSIRFYKYCIKEIQEGIRYVQEGLSVFTKTYPTLRRLRVSLPIENLPLLLRVFPSLDEIGVLITDRILKKDFIQMYPQIKRVSVYRYLDQANSKGDMLSRRDHDLV